MAFKPASLDAIVNAFIQVTDAKTIQEVLEHLPPKECHEVERRLVDMRGKEALDAVEKAEKARKK
jgi:hypothetical protein